MLAAAAQGSLLFLLRQSPSRRGGPIGVDDAGLRMRWIAESLAEQAFGRRGIAQRREQEVDGGTGGIDGPVYVTPTALHSNIRLVNTPGFVGRFEMMAQLVVSELKKEGSLRLAGLGIFRKRKSKARIGRNPATGETIKISARTRLRFTAAKALKDMVLGAK